MKAKYLALFIAVLVFGVSCDDSSDSNESTSQDALEGVWHLKNVRGGLIGIDLDYDRGDVSWNFNVDESELEVESNILTTGPKSIYQGLLNGIYSISIEEEDTTRTIKILATTFEIVEIDGERTLVIDEGLAADGFVRTFER